MNKILGIIVVLAVLIGGYWWWMQSQSAATQPTAGNPSQTTGTGVSPTQGNAGQPASGQPVQTSNGTSQNLALGESSNATLGTYLIGNSGMTVYTYGKDTPGKSTCTGTCAQNWPPYRLPAGSALNLQAGITGAIGAIAREDGTTQVTYKGMPLYFYAGDKTSSDTNGQGVGGVWYVVKP